MQLCAFIFLYVAQCLAPMPALDELPVVATWYDPALGGINCDHDCRYLADGGEWGAGDYGSVAACIKPWRGRWVEVMGLGVFHCRDTGGAIRATFDAYHFAFVIRFDVMSDRPIDCNYCLYPGWAFVQNN